MKKAISVIESIVRYFGKIVSWLVVGLVILVVYDVITRYLFNFSKNWVMELEWHFFALIFLLGIGYTLQADKHVRVDVFYTNFSEQGKAWVNLIGSLFLLIPWTLILMLNANKYAYHAWKIGEGSTNPGGLPARYVIKYAIVMGMFLLLLQGLSMILKSIMIILQKNKA